MPTHDFWRDFAASCWEKVGCAVPRDFGFPGAPSAEELFELTVRACWERQPVGRPRVFFDQQGSSDKALWPTPEDRSFAQYEERVRRRNNGHSFLLVVNNLQAFDMERWNGVRRLLTPLLEQVGFPSWNAELTIFVGSYPRTPFGVHRDTAGVMHFPVVGTKRIRTWTSEFVERHPELKNAVEYSEHLEASELLEAGPGGMLYWPSDAWHVGEGAGELSVTWGVGFWYRPLREHVMLMADRLITQVMGQGEGRMQPTLPFEAASQVHPRDLPGLSKEVQRLMAEDVFSPAAIERAVTVDWLRRRTAWGFTAVPLPLAGVSLTGEDRVFQDPEFPIVRARSGEHIWLAANGHAFAVSDHPVVDALLDRVAAGDRPRVGDLVNELTRPTVIDGHEWTADADTILEILRTLCSFRGLIKVNGPEG